jgi:hypothetical protein
MHFQIRVPLRALLGLPAVAGGEEVRQVRVQAGGTLVPVEPGTDGTEGNVLADALPGGETWSFSRESVLQLPMDWSPEGERRELLLSREVFVPAGEHRFVSVVHDVLARQVAADVVGFTVPEEAGALGSIRLTTENPEVVLIEAGDDVADDVKRRKGDRIRPEAPLLSPRTRIVEPPVLPEGQPAHLVYGLCLPEGAPPAGEETGPTPFDGWSLDRFLSCSGRENPANLGPRELSPPEPGEACVLLEDALPLDLGPGACSYRLELHRPGKAAETAVLELEMVSGSEEGPGPD